MSLALNIRHEFGGFTLDAAFAASGRLTALFGPSGAGKTSIVNAIAGLFRPAEGRIEIDGTILQDSASGIFLPAHRRRVGYVFQEARLFPHLSVRGNLRYGGWFGGGEKNADHFDEIVALLGLEALLERRPSLLSGGEKSRVAIGRALLARPQLLLMDEPLASLDEQRRLEILPFLERLRDEAGIPIVYVSHAIAEIARLASDIVAIAGGRVVAFGSAAAMLSRIDLPVLSASADWGAVVTARIVAHDEAFGLTRLAMTAGNLTVERVPHPVGSNLRIRVRARDILLSHQRPEGLSALNALPGRILAMAEHGLSEIDIQLECGGQLLVARITRYSAQRMGLAPGGDIFAIVKTAAIDPGGVG